MPFVSEELYLSLPHNCESINLETWPKAASIEFSEEEMTSMSQLLTMIEAVRALKKDYNLKPSMDINIVIKDENQAIVAPNASINAILQRMCHATWVGEASDDEMASRTILNGT